MKVAVLDCGSGNLRSVANAFRRVAGETALPVTVEVTDAADRVRSADRIVLPGQGAFAVCRDGIEARPGLREALEARVLGDRVPYLGICVGMQLLARTGRERGVHAGFDWLGGEVAHIPKAPGRRIPHMGWNDLETSRDHPLLAGLGTGEHVYFVHSYRYLPAERGDVIATAEYGVEIVAAVARGNVAGTQFHPEKSQRAGLRLIANFLRWTP